MQKQRIVGSFSVSSPEIGSFSLGNAFAKPAVPQVVEKLLEIVLEQAINHSRRIPVT
jgi:hypothetical protein